MDKYITYNFIYIFYIFLKTTIIRKQRLFEKSPVSLFALCFNIRLIYVYVSTLNTLLPCFKNNSTKKNRFTNRYHV